MTTNVLLVRVAEFANKLSEDVNKAGYQSLLLPSLVICPVKAEALPSDVSMVIFISMGAVQYGHHLLTPDYEHVKIVAIGQATANKLKEKNIQADIVPNEGSSSEILLALPNIQNLAGERIVIIRGVGGREVLKNELSVHNEVIYREVYHRKPVEPTDKIKQTLTNFLREPNGMIVFSSVDGLNALLGLAQAFDINARKLYRYPVVTLSERIAETVKAAGFINQIKAAKVSSNEELVEAITQIRFDD